MSRKTLVLLLLGVAAAGLVCLIVGLIVHLTVKDSPISQVISLFAIIFGAFILVISLFVIATIYIVDALKKSKNK